MMTPEQFDAWKDVADKANIHAQLCVTNSVGLSDERRCELEIAIKQAMNEWIAALFKFHELLGEA